MSPVLSRPAPSWAAASPPPATIPARPATPTELRADLDQAYRLIPGRHRLNLHAIYAETGGVKVERDELLPEHFSGLDRLGQAERPWS